MRLGLLPSHQRALRQTLKKARKFDEFRSRTRRSFLLLGLAACSASAGTFFLGRRTTATESAPSRVPEPALQQAHRLATGPIESLIASYATYLLTLEHAGDAPALWVGYARLVDVAVQRKDRQLAKHLLETAPCLPKTLTRFTELLLPVERGQ